MVSEAGVNRNRRCRKKSSMLTIFRLITFLVCVMVFGGLLTQIWLKWFDNVERIVLTPQKMPNWKIPFPAITVCSESKIRQTLYNFTEKFHDMTSLNSDELTKFEALSLVCGNHLVRNGTKYTDGRAVDLIKSVAPDLKSLLYICLWKTSLKKCESFFKPILTEEGLCFTFNMLEPTDLFTNEMGFNPYSKHGTQVDGWNWDEGYLELSKYDAYPIRATDSGVLSGMTLVLRSQNEDVDHLCRGTSQGFKISLHSPADYPSVSQHYINIPFEKEVIIKIRPYVISTSKDLIDYNPHRRRCYFSNERKLQFFKHYSEKNCELECLSNYTMVLCGCVTFSMPRDSLTPICSAGSVKCATFARSDLSSRRSKLNIFGNKRRNAIDNDEDNIEEALDEIVDECGCLPSCISIDYQYEASQSKYDKKLAYTAYREEADEKNESLARVSLYFENTQFIAYDQTKVTNQSYLFATTVAVLGILFILSVLGTIDCIIKIHKIYFALRSNRKLSKTSVEVGNKV